MVNEIIKAISRPIIGKNKQYKNLYQGEECYIFGNGVSLKWFDLAKFSDKKALTCGWLYLHKEFRKLHVVADISLHPLFLYPYWKNVYTLRWVKNPMSSFLRKSGKFNFNHPVFVSLSNYPALYRYANVRYLHHFGNRVANANKCSLAGDFSYMNGSLYALLGIAAYMGFKKLILVGMDYTFERPLIPHFYEKGKGTITTADPTKLKNDIKLFQDFKNSFGIEMKVVLPSIANEGVLPGFYYKNYFSTNDKFRENDELLTFDDLQALASFEMSYSIF